jgi:hypothetical protein
MRRFEVYWVVNCVAYRSLRPFLISLFVKSVDGLGLADSPAKECAGLGRFERPQTKMELVLRHLERGGPHAACEVAQFVKFDVLHAA